MPSKFTRELMNANANNSSDPRAENTDDNKRLRITLEFDRLSKLFQNKAILKVGDLVDVLGYKEEIVYRLFNSDEFPVIIVGKSKGVTLSKLAEWLAG